jgi:2-dehydropantoate 2-reductase
MKYCVYGAGSIGGVIAARLALSGVETAVIARGEHLAAIRANGLRFVSPAGSEVAKVTASDDPKEVGPQDVVIAAVKAHQLPAIAEPMRALLHEKTTVLYAVNGLPWWYFHKEGGRWSERQIERLDPGGRLWNGVGVDRTIGCVVNLPATVEAPGIVHWEGGNNHLSLGELGGGQTPRLTAIADTLRKAGIAIDTGRPIRFEMWNKLTLNMVASPIAILTASPLGAVIGDAGMRQVAKNLWVEGNAIAAALGIDLDPNVDAKLDRWATPAGQRPHRPSILQDFERGRPLEIDPQLTVPIELAHELGVTVPTLDLLAGLMRARAKAAGVYPA